MNQNINCLQIVTENIKCEKKIMTIPKGTLLFTGIGNKTADKNIYKHTIGTASRQDSFDPNKYDLTQTHILTYAMVTLGDVVIDYAKNAGGVVLVGELKQDISLYIFVNSSCDPYFDTREDYNSDEAQCFCKHGTNGYANSVYNALYNPYALTDIMICDASIVLNPIAYLTLENVAKYIESDRTTVINSIGRNNISFEYIFNKELQQKQHLLDTLISRT